MRDMSKAVMAGLGGAMTQQNLTTNICPPLAVAIGPYGVLQQSQSILRDLTALYERLQTISGVVKASNCTVPEESSYTGDIGSTVSTQANYIQKIIDVVSQIEIDLGVSK